MRTILKVSFSMVLASIAAAVLLTISGCGSSNSSKPVVVGTTTQVSDLVREVAGDRIKVVSIVSPNVDIHEFEPRVRDIDAIEGSRVVFTSGAGVDDWADKLIEGSGSEAREIDIFRSLPVGLKKTTGLGGDPDPHWWGNPRNAVAAVNLIQAVLSKEFPADAAAFKKNAENFKQRAQRLDRQIARCFKRIPESKRKLITNHSSFGYFADSYGLEYVGSLIPSLSTEAQPSAGEIRKLVVKIKKEHIPAIFTEGSVSPKLANAVAKDAGISAAGPLYIDSLGPKGSGADTWIGATRHNARVVLRGLGGEKAAICLRRQSAN